MSGLIIVNLDRLNVIKHDLQEQINSLTVQLENTEKRLKDADKLIEKPTEKIRILSIS
jgi:predicted  nucleic acid-binding Zn-ribbon protein